MALVTVLARLSKKQFWPEESPGSAPQPTVRERIARGVELPLRPEMRALTLTLTLAPCEGSFMVNSRPFCTTNGIKALLFPPSSPLSQKKRKRCSWNVLRHVRQWIQYGYIDEKSWRHQGEQLSLNLHDTELQCPENYSSKTTLELIDTKHKHCSVDKSLEDISNPNSTCTYDSAEHNKLPFCDICKGVKFAIPIGLLNFLVCQQALADTELPGVQPMTYIGDLGDISTGFASALLAARSSGAVVFTGTFGALAAMSVVSVVLGRTFHYVDGILPFRFGETDFPIDDFAAFCLLVYFGVTTLLEAASDDEQKIKEEQEEAEIAISELSGNGAGIIAAANTAISTFLLVFVAEWGDKSFFSTIALAAASSPLGVIGGALAGHALATLLAVVGGSLMGTFLSEKVIAYIGGTLFLVFAMVTLVEIVS
ncbi:GDT1-like protein 1, chloroplastic isoform X3 [Elaeis guineensis]|uniref:GDT1-like protein 1, chloroplastic isoform X2 n=1 Tax=Elaeis guineensis var. tenera TaxID=51953 RepID=A0A6I9QWV3_ELAGV|nr:GDT1-like protein 1, chloroplastic isoform X2 [Elaeis guineensis]